MATDTGERTPLDDPLMVRVRATLDAVDAAVAARPAVAPDWDRVRRAMATARRRRRRVLAARLGAGVVALGAGCAVVMSGAVPYPSFAPVVAVPGTAGRSALDDGRTRGSLGSDDEWLGRFRQRVAHLDRWDESGGDSWSPPAARNVSVIFAGDVGAYRLALVEGDWHWGPIGGRQQVWFIAPAGAAPEAMNQGANGDPEDINQMVASPGYDPLVKDGAGVVVVSNRTVRVEMEGSPTVRPDGSVVRNVQRLNEIDGAYVAGTNHPGQYSLSIAGRTDLSQTFAATDRDAGGQPDVPVTSLRAVRGDREVTGDFTRFADATRQVIRQPGGSGHLSLLAMETTPRKSPTGGVRAMVGSLTLPGGARLLAGGAVPDGPEAISRVDSAVLLPAGDDDEASIAWQEKPDAESVGWTAAMGPAGTRAIEWLLDDGTTMRTYAVDCLGTTARTDVRSVRFLDRDHRRIGVADLTDPVGDLGLLPAVIPLGIHP